MKTFIKTSIKGLIVTLIASPFLMADEPVEEIVVKGKVLYADQVNALKTPTDIVDVPQSLSIVTDEQIRKQGIREIGDIVRYTPGVNTSQGEGHRDAVVFRGVRSTADFYQDGARDDVQYYRSLYNVEQVEVGTVMLSTCCRKLRAHVYIFTHIRFDLFRRPPWGMQACEIILFSILPSRPNTFQHDLMPKNLPTQSPQVGYQLPYISIIVPPEAPPNKCSGFENFAIWGRGMF